MDWLRYLATTVGSLITVKFKRSSSGRDDLFRKNFNHRGGVVACLQWKASVQCGNIQALSKTYLYLLFRGRCVKSICQTQKGLLGRKKVQKAFGQAFGQYGQASWVVLRTSGTSQVGTLEAY